MSKEGPSGGLVKNVSDGRGVKGEPFGPINKNVSDGRGVKGGPFGPISKKRVGRTGC